MSFHSPNNKRRYFEQTSQNQKEWLSKIRVETWAKENPIEWVWINKNKKTSRFAKSINETIEKTGQVTLRQIEKIKEIIKNEK